MAYNGIYDTSAFTILPKNGSYFLTLTEDSLVYDNYCVDRAFRPKLVTASKAVQAGFKRTDDKPGYTFAGTAAVFCQPGWASHIARARGFLGRILHFSQLSLFLP